MRESFLHFVYKNRLWEKTSVSCTNGDSLEIIDVGTHNHDSGPDFFNAKIKIGKLVWVGNVEIHVKSSDWDRHKHYEDLSYNNVILHIVYKYDRSIYIGDSKVEIPSWEIRFPHIILNKYYEFKNTNSHIPCKNYLEFTNINKSILWLERMAVERLEYKSKQIIRILEEKDSDIEETFFTILARSFGFGINAEAFEMLAKSISLKLIRKYSDNITTIEAILFGQSGILPKESEEKYIKELIIEYEFIKKKDRLQAISKACWKFSKMRPSNFPELRIAQLSAISTKIQGLFSSIIDINNINEIIDLLDVKASKYWQNHYKFATLSKNKTPRLGQNSINNIIINTIIPFIFVYFNIYRLDAGDKEKAIDWLIKLKAEKNRYTKAWEDTIFSPCNAYQSQALTNLKKQYCDKRECLNCNIGIQIFNSLTQICH